LQESYVKEFCKWVRICQSYDEKCFVFFTYAVVYMNMSARSICDDCCLCFFTTHTSVC